MLVHVIATLAASLSPRFLGDEAEACEPATCAAGAGGAWIRAAAWPLSPGAQAQEEGTHSPGWGGPLRGPHAARLQRDLGTELTGGGRAGVRPQALRNLLFLSR